MITATVAGLVGVLAFHTTPARLGAGTLPGVSGTSAPAGSGRPIARAASASVTGPDLGLADALATAVAVVGPPGLDMVEALDGYGALIIALDGSRRWTERFPFAPREAAPPR